MERVEVIYMPRGKVGQRDDRRQVPVLADSRKVAKTQLKDKRYIV